MSTSTSTTTPLKGGEWLIKESNAFETFTPEDFNEEQQMVKEMCLQFLQTEVVPIVDRIDKMEEGLMQPILVLVLYPFYILVPKSKRKNIFLNWQVANGKVLTV